jgi:predicted GIY-YIG superfamily endonuclease
MKAKAKATPKTASYTIYQISNGKDTYVGMTTQSLSARFSQHKKDAKTQKCSVSSKLCQKEKPKDLQAFHKALRENPTSFTISRIKDITGTYEEVHKAETAMKNKYATF